MTDGELLIYALLNDNNHKILLHGCFFVHHKDGWSVFAYRDRVGGWNNLIYEGTNLIDAIEAARKNERDKTFLK